jgi:hypothetical protein
MIFSSEILQNLSILVEQKSGFQGNVKFLHNIFDKSNFAQVLSGGEPYFVNWYSLLAMSFVQVGLFFVVEMAILTRLWQHAVVAFDVDKHCIFLQCWSFFNVALEFLRPRQFFSSFPDIVQYLN